MRNYFIYLLIVCSLVKVDRAWSQCNPQNQPTIVRIQADACGVIEKQNEFFQFINGGIGYNLNTNNTTINSSNGTATIQTNGFSSVTSAFLNSLNSKVRSCPSLPIFLDPFKSPYNGIIPPNSVVLAFIDPNPNSDALKSSSPFLDSFCTKSKIFVIRGNDNHPTGMFVNKTSCTGTCLRQINIVLGQCSFSFTYDGTQLVGGAGGFIKVIDNTTLVYLASDGCIPFSLPCDKPKFINPDLSPLTCNSVGHQLPSISEISNNLFTGNAGYFTMPGRKGTYYQEGTVLFDSITLYANDYNSCDSAGTSIEKTYKVDIIAGPKIDSSMNRTEVACGFFVLPDIKLKNPSGNQKYWTDSLGVGDSFKIGDTIYTSKVLYAYDKNLGCTDSKKLTIRFQLPPSINNLSDTMVPCSKTYVLDTIRGKYLFSAAYYTAPNKGGNVPGVGTLVSSTTTYYIYDSVGHCFDEDTFTVTIPTKPILSSDIFRNDTFCSQYVLPKVFPDSTLPITYNTQPDGKGIPYQSGSNIFSTVKLYYTIGVAGCMLQDAMVLTKRKISIAPVVIDEPCKPVLDALPMIKGDSLTSNVAYWSSMGGQGKKYLAGDTVHADLLSNGHYADRLLYLYDSAQYHTGSCVSEIPVKIPFSNTVEINALRDTFLKCDQTFKIPSFTPAGFLNQAVYDSPGKTGKKYAIGDIISNPGTYYTFADSVKCFDEDTFKITQAIKPILPRDTFRNDTFCTSFILPSAASGITLKYKDEMNNSFAPGTKISSSIKLIYTASIIGCDLTDTMSLTKINNPVINNNIKYSLPNQCNPILDSLPKIMGTNLTSSVAYYSDSLGKGKRYGIGDSVHAFKPNYFYEDKILYAYDEAKYHYETCPSKSVQVTIPFFRVTEADPIKDTTLKCNQPFIAPKILPDVFFSATQAIYSLPNKGGNKYTPGQAITQSGTYYTFSERLLGSCFDEDTFKVNILPSPSYFNNVINPGCDSVLLNKINGAFFNVDSTFYFDQPFGKGKKYTPNTITTRAGIYYIFDKSQSCLVQDTITVTINKAPTLSMPSTTLEECDSVRLPQIAGLPDLRYYTQNNWGGNMKVPGDWVTKNDTLYAVTGIAGCYAQQITIVKLKVSPQLTPMRDTTACNEIILPKIQGLNLTGTEHYHVLSRDQGDYFYGDGKGIISKSMQLYVWDGDINHCYDEDTFNITIISKPVIDSIPPLTACESLRLPTPLGKNLAGTTFFYDKPGGTGSSYKIGDNITKSGRLYMYYASPYCPAEQAIDITIKDSITSDFTIAPALQCPSTPIVLQHTGKKAATIQYDWSINKSAITFLNQPNQSIKLDTGTYRITLQAKGDACFGGAKSQIVNVIPALDSIKNLTCIENPNSIAFNWDPLPGASGYNITAQGLIGVRSPTQIIYSNLTLGQRVTLNVSPNAIIPCANGPVSMLTCKTKICPPGTVQIYNEAPFCSGDPPREPGIQLFKFLPSDTIGSIKSLSGPGIVRDTFFPSIAGTGNHIIRFTLMTKDSCFYTDTAVYIVGAGSVVILNDKAVECAPPSQRQFNIRMQITTGNTPFNVYYSFSGGRSAVFPSSATNFTLSAAFGLIGDSIRIDSIVDSKGCKMRISSMANTQTFKAVQYISIKDTTSSCNFVTKAYQYRIKIKNVNKNDPLYILSGGGSIQDSFYISPPVPFNTRHQAVVSHQNGCDTLSWDLMIPCSCTEIRDTIRRVSCESLPVIIRGKTYTINNASGTDSIPSTIPGACDTIREVRIQFIRDALGFLRTSVCPDDIIKVGNTIFDKRNPIGVVRLPNAARSGCDSLVDVALDFKLPSFKTIRDTICAGESVTLGGIVFNAGHTRDSVRFMNQSANGCDSTVYYQVLVESIKATISIESAGCTATSGKSLLIQSVNGGIGPYSYAINNSNPVIIQATPLRISTIPSDTFALNIKSSTGCILTTPIAFVPLAAGLKINLGKDRTIKLGDTINIRFNANFTIKTFHWITQDYLSCTNCINPIAQPLRSTTYILEVGDANGCIARDTLRILVDPNINVFVPNILNTNSALDENHVLNIYPAPQIKSILRFTIFDRWGTNIVDLKNPALTLPMTVWDGRFKNADMPSAVYVYKIIYETIDGASRVKVGDFTLIR